MYRHRSLDRHIFMHKIYIKRDYYIKEITGRKEKYHKKQSI